MDIFNKKKVKSLEWDLMATKARLESKESELNKINNSLRKMYDAMEEAFEELYVGKYTIVDNNTLKVTKFSCQGGTPYVIGEDKDSVSTKVYISWSEVLKFETVKKPKIKK